MQRSACVSCANGLVCVVDEINDHVEIEIISY